MLELFKVLSSELHNIIIIKHKNDNNTTANIKIPNVFTVLLII